MLILAEITLAELQNRCSTAELNRLTHWELLISAAGFASLVPAAEWRPNGFGAPVYGSPPCSVNAFGGIFLHPRCPSPVSDGPVQGIRNSTGPKINVRRARVP